MALLFLPAPNQDKKDSATPVCATVDNVPPERMAVVPEVNAPQVVQIEPIEPIDLIQPVQAVQPTPPIPEIQEPSLPVVDELVANKQLPIPWDFNAVLVLSPEGSIGLGEFFAATQRMDALGVCHFVNAYSRFQGQGAATQLLATLQSALAEWARTPAESPDAIVIVGDAVSVGDGNWLNDADLAHYLGHLPIPVWMGVETDDEHASTLVDAAIHTRFDSPAKVIYGIQQVMAQRAAEAKFNFEQLSAAAIRLVQSAKTRADALDISISTQARRQLAQGRHSSAALMDAINLHASRERHGMGNADQPI